MSTETDCSIANQFVIGCSIFSDAPIYIPNANAGDKYLIEVTTDSRFGSRLLHVDKLSCSGTGYVNPLQHRVGTTSIDYRRPALGVRSRGLGAISDRSYHD